MELAALAAWVVTALFGGYLLGTWLVNGGLRPRPGDRPSRFAPPLIFGHATLAASGLGVWIAYLVAGRTPLAWTALAVLAPVAVLGATMFGLWLRAGHGRARGRHAYAPRHAAEDHFPPPAVIGHGLFALTTVALVAANVVRAVR